MSNSASYYWTTFLIDGADPNELHCTHKFLGELPDADARKVRKAIDERFKAKAMPTLAVEFDRPALFGKNGDVPVLIATENTKTEISAFGDLRATLDQFRADDFPEYIPHVTTDRPHLVGSFTGYVLMRGKVPVKRWRAARRYANAGDLIKLAPVREHTDDFDELEREIVRAFRKKLYAPILEILGVKGAKLVNTKSPGGLKAAIAAGRVNFRHGEFTGRFSAEASKELKALGAVWDKKRSSWRISTSQLPEEIRKAITASNARWQATLERIDAQFRQILPAEIAGQVDSAPLFDSSLWKTDRKLDNTLKSISVLPKLSPERRKRIAEEWRDNLDLWIKDFAAQEIPKLRDDVAKSVLAGGRFEDLVSTLQKSYGVTQRKAHFLARQETNLLMAKFKETRYAEAGVHEYVWKCVAGSAAHPVRPSHLALKDKVFRFDNPPITTAPGEPPRRNNPGEDYNCRCYAVPVIRAERATKRKRA
jgi:SPP1 gp7 family putative phage head morphogenesis protein